MDLSERLLTRRELHELLREHGFPIGWSTLTKLATPARVSAQREVAA
jgi:hypothetical protein